MKFLIVAEHVGMMMIPHRHDHSNPNQISDQRRATSTDKWQRNPSQWQKTDIHSNVFKNVEKDHHNNPG